MQTDYPYPHPITSFPSMGQFRHVKRGTVYTLLDIIQLPDTNYEEGDVAHYPTAFGFVPATIQVSTQPELKLCIYMPFQKVFELWARPVTEFFDGRFEQILI